MSIRNVAGARVLRMKRREDILLYHADREADSSQSVLMMVTSGAMFFNFGKAKFTANKDDIVCWGPSFPRERLPLPGQPASFILLFLEILSGAGGKLGFSDIGFPPLIRVRSPDRVRSILDDIDKALNSREPSRGLACSILGLQLLKVVDEDRVRVTRPEKNAQLQLHSRIRESLEYIQNNFKKRLDVAALSKRACMHPTYFAHLFRKEIGVSPHQYVLDYKIEKAKEFLCTFDEALDYTANELGFHDYSHFYRAFKKIVGMTPMRFIRENKGLYNPR